MLSDSQLSQLDLLGERAAESRFAFLRHLLLMATGALTLLVSLQAGSEAMGMARWWLRGTWVGLGLGILCGSIALAGDMLRHRARLELVAAELAKTLARMNNGERGAVPSPIVRAGPPWWLLASERGCYLALGTAVVCLVGYAISMS